jgi:hypothetical protein
MEARYLPNTIFPSGDYEIIYGEAQEFGMGGPYASSIYLKPKDKAPFCISSMCFKEVIVADDESCFYFMFLNVNRNLQVMQYEMATNTLKLFKDVFNYAEIETASTKYGYSVNGKNWVEATQSYNEGLIICDTNDINVEKATIIEPRIHIWPRFGIEIVSFYDDRKTVNERLKGAVSHHNEKIDFYTKYGFHIHYNDEDRVEFIEIMGDMESTFELYEKNPFTTDVDEMVAILGKMNDGDENLIQAPTSYIYLELGLGIFRDGTPENFEKYIQECKAENPDDFINGTPEWLLIDYEKTKHFQTIGLGDNNYFRNPIYYKQ